MTIVIGILIVAVLIILFMISVSKLKTDDQIHREDEEQIKYLQDILKSKKGEN